MNINKELVLQKLNAIHNIIRDKEPVNDGFLNGRLGLLCYYYYAGMILKKPEFTECAGKLLEQVFDGINTQNHRLHFFSFGNGLAGFAFVVNHLHKKKFIEIDIQSELSDVDKLLFDIALELMKEKRTDYLHGAFGIIHYFSSHDINKKIINYIDALLNAFYKNAVVEDGDGIWFRNCTMRNEDNDNANFGLAHGLCGMLLILINICKKTTVFTAQLKEIIQKGIAFILAHQQQAVSSLASYSVFPFIITPGKINGEQIPNRLAWCYGDLNEVLVLYRAGILFEHKGWLNIANAIGNETILRNDEQATLVTDAHFCHGASGIAQLYKTLYKETHLKKYQAAYKTWINKTVSLLNKDLSGNTFASKETDLLEGLIGPALVLLSGFAAKEISWNEMLLL